MAHATALSDLWPGSQPAAQQSPRLVTPLGFDPIVPPTSLTPIADLCPRRRVAVAGTIAGVAAERWVGGPVFEVTVDDGTGSLLLAFFGRCHVAGIEPGRHLVTGGTVGLRGGAPILLNPHYWLRTEGPAPRTVA